MLLGRIAIGDWLTCLISVAALVSLFRWKLSNPLLMPVTATAGLIAFPLMHPSWVIGEVVVASAHTEGLPSQEEVTVMWNRMLAAALMFGAIAATGSLAWSEEDEATGAAVAKYLPSAQVTLQQGLAAAESQGQPISGKFEVDEGHFQLSVYTARGGKFSEVIVDHVTGKIAKSEAITGGDDLADTKKQMAASE